jgi:hypothetical protein
VLKIPVETILKNPLYFGQKDLALTRKGYEFDLLNKIIGDKVPDITEEYKNIQSNLCDDINDLRLLTDIPSKISDINNENLTLEHKLQVYKEKGLDEKLKKQTSCNTDLVKLEAISDWIKEMVSSINTAYLKQERNLLTLDGYSSQYNAEIFQDVEKYIGQTNVCLDSIKTDINILKEVQEGLILTKKKLIEKIDSLKDEFAEIKREINDEQLDADSYVSYQKKLSTNKEKITTLQEKLKSKEKLKGSIQNAFNQRNAFLEKNYIEYKKAIGEINKQQDMLSISIEFKGDKSTFKEDLTTQFKGTGLSDVKYNEICTKFSDLPEIVEDYYLGCGNKIKDYCTDNIYSKMAQKIEENYIDMIASDTPDIINISYHGKPLSKHSLGQRASALILFILTQHDSDVIIVDQPEDDLDNQVIYEELIQTIRREKKDMQFIFATHNANIPVLGDAERVVTSIYSGDESVELMEGTIDSAETHRDIVNIMEGGVEAFKKRNEIYGNWE